MRLDSAGKLGMFLQSQGREQKVIKDNLSPQDTITTLFSFSSNELPLNQNLSITKKTFANNSFIVDHPVHGDVDSSIYLIDGGYSGFETVWIN